MNLSIFALSEHRRAVVTRIQIDNRVWYPSLSTQLEEKRVIDALGLCDLASTPGSAPIDPSNTSDLDDVLSAMNEVLVRSSTLHVDKLESLLQLTSLLPGLQYPDCITISDA